ncbi:CDP-diacylglycerol--serine O-phosphatidyltransferase [uncultured Alistipes sp.]|uniref:CDP-diacylglycerol--serine O-phosphatidyltransferase n=1 Tax=uncultured Alistipes sp. TaxID=538949 RepID=UPI00261743CF|nr:CDP-diacylglycerol--serine O-phosphatidyltransferase [uncultured Alistipes sp.]
MKVRFFTIPNLLTLSNLMCGTFAALAALVYDNLEWAFWFVILAAVFDFFDGFAARLLRQSSPIGVQLDSLADMISFGFVPAAVLYAMTTRTMGEEQTLLRYAYAVASFLLAAFSALRLAKFNIDDSQHEEFCGLPTPANALFFTSLGLISARTGFDFGGEWLICIMPVMAWLLISPVRMFSLKFKGFGWRGNEIRYLFLALCVALIAILQLYSIPTIILLYILVSAVRWGLRNNRNVIND